MKAQLASPGFTHIYAALVAVVNTKLPEVGELLLKRVSPVESSRVNQMCMHPSIHPYIRT